jgi:hypothetical protein
MAQTGYTPISIYYSSTASNTPTAGNLVAGELAINTQDGKLFYKDAAGVVQVIGTKGGVGSSSTTQVLYNSSGLVVGSANMTFNGTTLTLANDASISGLTVGKGGGAVSTNTVIGSGALAASAGIYGTAIGYNTSASSTGNYNVAVGSLAFSAASNTGTDSVAVGVQSLSTNTSGSFNAAVGKQSLQNNTTGSYNSAFGMYALGLNTTASRNTAVGYQAAYSNTTGAFNAVLGYQALYLNTTGERNVAVGEESLYANTTGAQNTALGMYALNANTTASYNTAVGYQACNGNTTGAYNTAIGQSALLSNTTASNNTAVGYQALYTASTSSVNTAVGYQAGYSHNGSAGLFYNTFIGDQAGYSVTGGYVNTLIGHQSGYYITTGYKNSILGSYNGNQGGLDIRTASNYIVLSDGDGNPNLWLDNNKDLFVPKVYVSTTASAANVFVTTGGQLVRSTSALKYKTDVRDLESIDVNKFRPVRYKSNCEGDDQTLDHFGIIADEVDQAGIKELVSYGADGEVEGFQYERLTVVLLKTIQDLQKRIKILEAK